MRLLLDTHVAVWAVMGDERLSASAIALIADPSSEVHVSAVSLWEIAIKFASGRAGDPMPFSATDAQKLFHESGFQALCVEPDHAAAVDRLPPLHGDPFDRLLIAQAITAPMRFLTRDSRLVSYSELVTLA